MDSAATTLGWRNLPDIPPAHDVQRYEANKAAKKNQDSGEHRTTTQSPIFDDLYQYKSNMGVISVRLNRP